MPTNSSAFTIPKFESFCSVFIIQGACCHHNPLQSQRLQNKTKQWFTRRLVSQHYIGDLCHSAGTKGCLPRVQRIQSKPQISSMESSNFLPNGSTLKLK
jgi:hypothetical protein